MPEYPSNSPYRQVHAVARGCSLRGHDYRHQVSATGVLVEVQCARCGRSWPLAPAYAHAEELQQPGAAPS